MWRRRAQALTPQQSGNCVPSSYCSASTCCEELRKSIKLANTRLGQQYPRATGCPNTSAAAETGVLHSRTPLVRRQGLGLLNPKPDAANQREQKKRSKYGAPSQPQRDALSQGWSQGRHQNEHGHDEGHHLSHLRPLILIPYHGDDYDTRPCRADALHDSSQQQRCELSANAATSD